MIDLVEHFNTIEIALRHVPREEREDARAKLIEIKDRHRALYDSARACVDNTERISNIPGARRIPPSKSDAFGIAFIGLAQLVDPLRDDRTIEMWGPPANPRD